MIPGGLDIGLMASGLVTSVIIVTIVYNMPFIGLVGYYSWETEYIHDNFSCSPS